MKSSAVSAGLTAVLSLLPDKIVKKAVDACFDAIEDAVKQSSNKVDDAIVLPVINKLRSIFDISDNDEVVNVTDAETPADA